MKLLLFDVDLTLVNTGGAGLRALDEAFREVLGVAGATEGVTPHGKTDPAIIREVCLARSLSLDPDVDSIVNRIVERYVHFLEKEVVNTPKYRVLPGILEILEEVDQREDVLTGLATGNVEAGARLKLERGGLNRYFSFGGYGSDSEERAEVVRTGARAGEALNGVRIAPEDVFVIGDTPLDVAAGKLAGFSTVAVATGGFGLEELAGTEADLVITDFSEGRDQFLRSIRIV